MEIDIIRPPKRRPKRNRGVAMGALFVLLTTSAFVAVHGWSGKDHRTLAAEDAVKVLSDRNLNPMRRAAAAKVLAEIAHEAIDAIEKHQDAHGRAGLQCRSQLEHFRLRFSK